MKELQFASTMARCSVTISGCDSIHAIGGLDRGVVRRLEVIIIGQERRQSQTKLVKTGHQHCLNLVHHALLIRVHVGVGDAI